MTTRSLRIGCALLVLALFACSSGGSSGPAGDTTRPTVAGSTPSSGATVPVTTDVVLTFSEAMDTASVQGAVQITPAVTCAWSWNFGSTVATCVHAAAFAYGTSYSVTVGTGAKDAAGNALAAPYSFTFGTVASVDTVKPTLVSTAPATGATVAVTTDIVLTFSEAMNHASVEAGFLIAPSVTCTWSWNAASTVATCAHAALPYATAYAAAIGTGLTDVAGNGLAAAYNFSFQTLAAPDTTPPTIDVASLVPAGGATGVSATTKIQVKFSEPVDQGASFSATLTPSGGSAVNLGAPAWSADGLTVSYQPAAALAFSTTYALAVAANDLAGNALSGAKSFTFTTAAAPVPDTTPPTVVAAAPSGDATVAVGTEIVLTFSEAMDPITTQAAFQATPNVTCTWSWDATSAIATCQHADLPFSTSYSVTVGTGAKDKAGNALAAPYNFTFKTPPPPDTIPPTIVVSALVPATNATGVAIDTTIEVKFSEPVDQGSTFSVTLTPAGGAAVDLGTPIWSSDNLTVTYTQIAVLAYATAYTLAVDCTDLAGNQLAAPKSFTFTTANPPPPTVLAVSPAEGSTADVAAGISFQFSQAMDHASVQAAFASNPAVTCAWNWSTDSTLATCGHAAALSYATAYTVTLGTGARDTYGSSIASALTLHFTTTAQPDTVKPVVCPATGATAPCASATNSTYPDNGVSGIARATNIVVKFSEPMDKASAQTAFAITAPAGHNSGVFTWNGAGDEMTFNPDVDFAYGDWVTFLVSTAAKDLAGNTLAAQFASAFHVIRTGTVTLTSVGSLDGRVTSTGSVLTVNETLWSGTSGGYESRGFLSFDLTSIPASATAITAATLQGFQDSVVGAPYTVFVTPTIPGVFSVESVDYGTSLDAGDFSTPVLTYNRLVCSGLPRVCSIVATQDYTTLSTDATLGVKSATVTSKVGRDLAARSTRGNRCQFRLRFRGVTDMTGENYVRFAAGENATVAHRPTLSVTYEYP